jgi:LacI family transcriptional regulator
MAAREFLSRGFEQFAFVGETRIDPCRTRYEEFARAVQHPCRLCDLSQLDLPANQAVEYISQWLAGQPLPLAVMAFNDPVGRWVTEACSLRGLHVPSDVALLGVDNDEVVCELSSPTLSSIYPNTRLRGRLAAELLARLMEGMPPGQTPVLVPPGRVFHRQSTDTLAFGDPDVRNALRFIRSHATDPIHVEDVMECVSCSRRTLETRFKRLLGRSLHEQIWTQRISRACQWLLESDVTVTQIALRCGSAGPSAFTQSFRRYVGMTPSQYRRAGLGQGLPATD